MGAMRKAAFGIMTISGLLLTGQAVLDGSADSAQKAEISGPVRVLSARDPAPVSLPQAKVSDRVAVASPQGGVVAAPVLQRPPAQRRPVIDRAPKPPAQAVWDCPVDLAVTAMPGGVLNLRLVAPCHRAERVVLRHGGLVFTEQTSASGSLSLRIPGMERTGTVQLRLASGVELSAAAALDGLEIYRRVAVQWVAQDRVAIRPARGGGEQAQMPIALGNGNVTLPMQAEILSWPVEAGLSPSLAIEAEVTKANCARDLLGEILISQNGRTETRELVLPMPDCGAVGEFLMLDNVF